MKPLPPTTGDAANGLRIVCYFCRAAATYGDAVRLRWHYDPYGKPFEAYYCANCHETRGAAANE